MLILKIFCVFAICSLAVADDEAPRSVLFRKKFWSNYTVDG
jgi:hypothetical protein